MQDEQPQFETVKTAAKLLNVSAFGLYRKLQSGELPGYKFGRKGLIDLAEVRAAMKNVRAKEA